MNFEIEKQKLKIAEMELKLEKQRLTLMELELVKNIKPATNPIIKPKLDNVSFCKTNSKLYSIERVTQNGVIYTSSGYRLKLNIKEIIKLKNNLASILKKRNTPRFWEILAKKYNVSTNLIERIVFNLVKGSFDDVITKWNNYHLQYNNYGEVIVGGN